MALDEPKDSDETCDLGGVTYMVDKELLEQVGRVSIDYLQRGWRAGFVISSEKPLAFGIASCGGSCEC